MEIEWNKLMKLKNMEENMAALLQKIDNEIIQTDVEWMHLKNIAEAQKNLPHGQADSKDNILNIKPIPPIQEWLTKSEHDNIDDQRINNMELDLSLRETNLEDLELESD